MKMFLIMEDGSKLSFDRGDSFYRILTAIRDNKVKAIVCGDVLDKQVVWEKQFTAVDILPESAAR